VNILVKFVVLLMFYYSSSVQANEGNSFIQYRLGLVDSEVRHDTLGGDIQGFHGAGTGINMGVSSLKMVEGSHFIGAGVDYSRVDGSDLFSLRALDYRYQNINLMFGSYIRAARI